MQMLVINAVIKVLDVDIIGMLLGDGAHISIALLTRLRVLRDALRVFILTLLFDDIVYTSQITKTKQNLCFNNKRSSINIKFN